MASHQADIIVVGGGMVGLTLALALGKVFEHSGKHSQQKIVVLERQPFANLNTDDTVAGVDSKPDLRVSAITRASQNIFRNLGCWDEIQQQGISAYEKMHVWDALSASDKPASITFHAEELAEPDLGHIIENKKIIHGLLCALKLQKNVQLIAPVKLESAHWSDTVGTLTLTNNDRWSAPLLVAADGAHSWLRQQRKINISAKSYEHDAIVCNIKTEEPHQHCAWQRFLASGPLALLPLSDNHSCSIVWSTSKQGATELMKLDDHSFSEQLSEAFEYRLGDLRVDSRRASFPLVRRHTETYIKDGLALVGDAAHTIHPLAGQGVNLGLLDAISLAEVIEKALNRQQNYGQKQVLRPYERWRNSENIIMLELMDFFKNLYGSQQQSIITMRATGMNLVNRHKYIKNNIILRAMGVKGDLPRLAQMSRDPNLDGVSMG